MRRNLQMDEFRYLKQDIVRLRYIIKNKPDLKLKTDCVIKMFGNEFDIRKMNDFDLRMMKSLLDLANYPSMNIGNFTVREYIEDIITIETEKDYEYCKNRLKQLEDKLKSSEDLSRLIGF